MKKILAPLCLTFAILAGVLGSTAATAPVADAATLTIPSPRKLTYAGCSVTVGFLSSRTGVWGQQVSTTGTCTKWRLSTMNYACSLVSAAATTGTKPPQWSYMQIAYFYYAYYAVLEVWVGGYYHDFYYTATGLVL